MSKGWIVALVNESNGAILGCLGDPAYKSMMRAGEYSLVPQHFTAALRFTKEEANGLAVAMVLTVNAPTCYWVPKESGP